jgi:hypothetical protein
MIISLMHNIKKPNLFMHKIQYTFAIDKQIIHLLTYLPTF